MCESTLESWRHIVDQFHLPLPSSPVIGASCQEIYDLWSLDRSFGYEFWSLPDRSKWPNMVMICENDWLLSRVTSWYELKSEHMMHSQPCIQKNIRMEQPSWFSSVMCCFQSKISLYMNDIYYSNLHLKTKGSIYVKHIHQWQIESITLG